MADDIIELAVAIELECAALYEVFAAAFADNAELHYFWKLYAEAERYHGATIRIHAAAFQTAPDASQLVVGPVEMTELLALVRENRVRFERAAPTVLEALRLARQIEDSSAEVHLRAQFFKGHALAELFQKMAEEDRAHRNVLETAEQRFGGAAAEA